MLIYRKNVCRHILQSKSEMRDSLLRLVDSIVPEWDVIIQFIRKLYGFFHLVNKLMQFAHTIVS